LTIFVGARHLVSTRLKMLV